MDQARYSNGFIAFTLCAVLITGGLTACSSGGGGNGNTGSASTGIQLTGSIASSGTGTGYTIAQSTSRLFYAKTLSLLGFGSPAYAAIAVPTVDKVVAVPMERGTLTSWGMENSRTATIQTDGSFTLSLPKTTDWLLVLVNSSATGTRRFVGSVAMSTATADSLLNLPATDSTISAMNLGTVSRSTTTSNDAISSQTVTAVDFNLTSDQLTALAKTDDIFKNALNIVNNYGNFGNAATVWYQLRPDFSFAGNFSSLTTTFSSPNLSYEGLNFQLDQNADTVPMADVCNTAGTVALHPPLSAGVISMGSHSYSYADPIKNAGSGCQAWNGTAHQETTGSDVYACDGYENITYSISSSFTSSAIPQGFWEWKENGVVKAAFDIASINPPVTASGKIRGFVPSFKLNVDGSGKILSVDIQWYYYDELLDQYRGPLAQNDLKLLGHFIQGVEVKFDRTYGGQRQTDELYVDPVTTTNVVPTKEWYVVQHPANPLMETGLMGFYSSGGFGYFFHFWNTNMTL
jgi:hypothetical protein